jgi:hypothetical protein
MKWQIGPWRKMLLLKERVASLEQAYQRTKNNELIYTKMWLSTYRALQAQQKGCIRLRRKLDRALAKRTAKERES